MRLCPYVNSECKGAGCRFWYSKRSDCMIALDLELTMQGNEEIEAYQKVGIWRVDKDLSKVLTLNYLKALSRSTSISDSDKLLIENLIKERVRLQSLIDLKKGWLDK